MQYWINQDGVQTGPVDLDGLKKLALTSRAYVWHEGLPNWVSITQLPELQGLYDVAPVTVDDAQPQAVESPVNEGAQGAPVAIGAAPGQSYQPQQPAQPQGEWANPQHGQSWQAQGGAGQPAAPRSCPPTNLVWAILSTICCCLPAGIVAIIYSVKVSNQFSMGDFEGAERASETSAWWCIASIVLGIISMPLAFLRLMVQ